MQTRSIKSMILERVFGQPPRPRQPCWPEGGWPKTFSRIIDCILFVNGSKLCLFLCFLFNVFLVLFILCYMLLITLFEKYKNIKYFNTACQKYKNIKSVYTFWQNISLFVLSAGKYKNIKYFNIVFKNQKV